MKKILAITLLITFLPLFSGCTKLETGKKYKLDLEIWGVFDDSGVFPGIIKEYRKINPHIKTITYKKFDYGTYEDDLINALASGTGPDIFMINNAWMPRFEDKVMPAPAPITNEQEFRDNFVDVVVNDFLYDGKILSAPLSVDSLALYYNKDIFNSVGLTAPPTTWDEFNNAVKKITIIDDFGRITRSGVAMGTAKNINRSTDLLELLLLQNGAQMPTKNHSNFSVDKNIGENSLNFYTQFASLDSPLYSWNNRMHYSLDAFYEGTLGMMLNYSWHIDTIKKKNSKLNFAIAKIPQISLQEPTNYANYWTFVVSKNKTPTKDLQKFENANDVRAFEAWQFLKFLTFRNDGNFNVYNLSSEKIYTHAVNIDPAKEYLEITKKPAARRDLIEMQKTDSELGPFAYGNLIARSWYRQNSTGIETAWAEIIEAVNKGELTPRKAFELGSSRIRHLTR